MKVDMHAERLKQIKLVKIWFTRTKCEKCGDYYVHEKMWMVPRWGVNERRYEWFYCQHCLPTKQDVLNQVDNDNCMFGIYGVDSFMANKGNKDRIPLPNVQQPKPPKKKKEAKEACGEQ